MTSLSITWRISRLTPDCVLVELRQIVSEIVKSSPGATHRARLRKASRALRLPIGRVNDWWLGEVRRVEAIEAFTLLYYAEQLEQVAEADRDYRRQRRRYLAAVRPSPGAGGGAAVAPAVLPRARPARAGMRAPA
jgi:hypothetical protein